MLDDLLDGDPAVEHRNLPGTTGEVVGGRDQHRPGPTRCGAGRVPLRLPVLEGRPQLVLDQEDDRSAVVEVGAELDIGLARRVVRDPLTVLVQVEPHAGVAHRRVVPRSDAVPGAGLVEEPGCEVVVDRELLAQQQVEAALHRSTADLVDVGLWLPGDRGSLHCHQLCHRLERRRVSGGSPIGMGRPSSTQVTDAVLGIESGCWEPVVGSVRRGLRAAAVATRRVRVMPKARRAHRDRHSRHPRTPRRAPAHPSGTQRSRMR